MSARLGTNPPPWIEGTPPPKMNHVKRCRRGSRAFRRLLTMSLLLWVCGHVYALTYGLRVHCHVDECEGLELYPHRSTCTKLAAVVTLAETSGPPQTLAPRGLRTRPPQGSVKVWNSITSSSDGTNSPPPVVSFGNIWTSTDSGATWTEDTSRRKHTAMEFHHLIERRYQTRRRCFPGQHLDLHRLGRYVD